MGARNQNTPLRVNLFSPGPIRTRMRAIVYRRRPDDARYAGAGGGIYCRCAIPCGRTPAALRLSVQVRDELSRAFNVEEPGVKDAAAERRAIKSPIALTILPCAIHFSQGGTIEAAYPGRRIMKPKILFIIAAAGLAFATRSAADVSGTWLRESGVSQSSSRHAAEAHCAERSPGSSRVMKNEEQKSDSASSST